MVDENINDEDFDKPDPDTKLGDGGEKKDVDLFEHEEKGDDEEEELEALDVEIEGESKSPSEGGDRKFKAHSEEGRFGKRRNRGRHRDSRLVRDLQSELNRERARGDNLDERLKAVESSTTRMTSSTIDSQITEAQRYHDQARAAHAQAVKDGDGDRAAEALDLMMEARDTLNTLKASKSVGNDDRDARRTKEDVGDKNVVPKPDPKVMRMFEKWHDNNDWYDPGLRDKHSRILFHIDNALVAEGYDPRTQEYWEELDQRAKANPTLRRDVFDNDAGYDDGNDEESEMEEKREKKVNAQRRPAPQNGRTPQNGGGRKKIVVSRERADAMKQMGLQPGTSEWKRMAKKYENYDKQRTA